MGRFNNDWSGNAIEVDAIPDPKIDGVTCHLSQFTRGLLDRVTKGNWFEDPSNASIACRQTGPITVHKIERGTGGEEVFSERKSLIFKSIGVRADLRCEEQHARLCCLQPAGHRRLGEDGGEFGGVVGTAGDLG